MTSLDDLKASIPLVRLLEEDGHRLRKQGRLFTCLCPFHTEKSGSFTIYPDNTFHCYGCGAGTSVIDYIIQRDGIPFADAARALEQKVGVPFVCSHQRQERMSAAPKAEKKPPSSPLSDAELLKLRQISTTLATQPELCAKLARARRWDPETIHSLALEGSLGWEDGKLAFLYEYGYKLRWREGEKRRFAWHMMRENASSLWRVCLLKMPCWERVFITEGETDAITLINAGIERHFQTLVLAQPSATTFDPAWAALFEGKEVVMALDNDPSGAKGTAKACEYLRDFARKVSVIKWEVLANVS